jgi:hypothetical protein
MCAYAKKPGRAPPALGSSTQARTCTTLHSVNDASVLRMKFERGVGLATLRY